jgi:hypothetical protein
MCSTWWPAVFSVITSASAISRLVRPLGNKPEDLGLALGEPRRIPLAHAQRRPAGGLEDRVDRPLVEHPAADQLAQLTARLADGASRAVGAIVGDGVVGVGCGEQPGTDAELRRGRCAVIARPVEALVVCPRGEGERRQRRGALEHALGVVGVEANPLPLADAQRATLVPDPVGHRDPAQVMQQARSPDLRRLHARAAQCLHPGRRERGDPDRMPPQEPDLEIDELAERSGHRVQPSARDRRHRLGLHRDHPLPGVVGRRRAQEGIRLGERGIDDLGIIATTAAPPQRRDRRLWIAGLGERDEVVGNADDPKRPRDLLPGDARRHPVAVPARHQLAECAGHLLGHL